MSPSQRKCRLEHESDVLLTSSVYSFNLCRSQCRFMMALKECGCVPYFYRNTGEVGKLKANVKLLWQLWFTDKRGKKYQICDPKGMRCLGGIKGNWLWIAMQTFSLSSMTLFRWNHFSKIKQAENCLRMHAQLWQHKLFRAVYRRSNYLIKIPSTLITAFSWT